jgi:hypothetical protein
MSMPQGDDEDDKLIQSPITTNTLNADNEDDDHPLVIRRLPRLVRVNTDGNSPLPKVKEDGMLLTYWRRLCTHHLFHRFGSLFQESHLWSHPRLNGWWNGPFHLLQNHAATHDAIWHWNAIYLKHKLLRRMRMVCLKAARATAPTTEMNQICPTSRMVWAPFHIQREFSFVF